MADLQFPPYVLPLFVAAAIAAGLSVAVWRRRPALGVVPFVTLMAAVTEWSLGNALEQIVVDLTAKQFFARLDYIGITLVTVSWFLFALEYTGRQAWITRRNLRLLAIEPILVQVFLWTNDDHHLFWDSYTLKPSGSYIFTDTTFGPVFWVHAVYSYLLILAGTVMLLQAFARSRDFYRAQIVTMLIGVFAPWISNAIYLAGLSPLPGIDITALAFTVTGIAMAWGVYRYRLLDIVPVARDTVIESMSDAVFVLDSQNRIVDINPAALRVMGHESAAGVIGERPRELLPGYSDLLTQYQDIEEARTEIAVGDAPLYFELRISPLRDRRGALSGRVIMLRDISYRKRAEEQIRAQNEALKKANEELVIAREQAEEASRLKSEFLATISHELRTPLNSVIGYADLLLTGLAGPLNDKQRDYAQRSLSNGERLLTLINELLDLSKIEAGRFELLSHPFQIAELVSGVKTRMQGLAEKKGLLFAVSVDPALPPVLEGDAKRIEQVIVNLIGNAIKYTDQGRIDLRLEKAGEAQWAIVVSDTGIGIPPHALEFIFDEFRQVDGSTQRERQGTGLGLAIVRKITQLMGGTARADSEMNKGSAFTVKLPLVIPREEKVLEVTG